MLLHLCLAFLRKPGSKTMASEDLLCLKVKLLQSLSTRKQGDILRSGNTDLGIEIPPTVSCSSHILLRIWTKVPKTEMTEGKTFIKSPDFGTPYFSFCTASSTTNLVVSGVLLK